MLATDVGAETRDFLRRYYEAIDQRRTEEALASFAPDATVQASNEPAQPWMQGLQAMAGQLRGVAGTRHAITRLVQGADGEAAYELDVTYVLESGEEITLAGAVFCVIRDERFHHQGLYVDLAPVRDAIRRAG